MDVAVDLRKNLLPRSDNIFRSFYPKPPIHNYVPKGFGHGFVVLSDEVDFFYKCDNFYNKASEGGIIYNDPQINIDWRMQPNDLIISSKDISLPTLSSYKTLF